MKTVHGTVILAQTDHYQEMILSAALLSMNLTVRKVRQDMPLLHEIKSIFGSVRGRVVVCADLKRIAQERLLWPQFTGAVRELVGDVDFLATQSRLLRPTQIARAWAMKHGAYDLVGHISHLRMAASMRHVIGAMEYFFAVDTSVNRIAEFVSGMYGSIDENADEFVSLQKTWLRLEGSGQLPDIIAQAMVESDRVQSKDRLYRLTTYKDCFLGKDAATWIEEYLSVSRRQAEDVGNLLLKLGFFYHVAKDQSFRDGDFFYRLAAPEKAIELIDLDLVMEESRRLRGFDAQNRTWRGIRFPKVFVGSEAVGWLSSFYGINFNDAIALGQILNDIYYFRHVADEHDFVDRDYFYRMTIDH